MMLETNMGQSLVNIGKSFIPSDSSPLGKKYLKRERFFHKVFFIPSIIILAMVSRYFILSGIPITRTTISDEIRNMIQSLVENLQRSDFPDWNIFEFITKKSGRRGPSKKECMEYYNRK